MKLKQKLGYRLIFILLSCSLLLTGCWDRKEINDLAIVLATGIDYKNEKVQLTAQIFIPRKGGGTESIGSTGGSPSGLTMIHKAEGSTVAEALNRLQRKVSREMFWGHCEVIVFNEEASKQGLREYIDFFLRYPEFREHAYVFSSAAPAEEILALLDPLERSSAESLREMANLGLGAKITLLELVRSIDGPSKTALLSRLLISPLEIGQEKLSTTPYFKGISLFKKGKYVRTVEEPLSGGVLLLANELNNFIIPISIKSSKGVIAIRLNEANVSIQPHIKNQKWSVKMLVKARGDIVMNTTNVDLADPKVISEVRQAWSDKLQEYADQAVVFSQNDFKADLFKTAVQFRRYYPKQWQAQKNNWDKIYREMDISVVNKVVITHTGKSTEPQGEGKSD